jgi:hypothetical protein
LYASRAVLSHSISVSFLRESFISTQVTLQVQVLTGVASLEDARAKAVDCQPHYYTGSLGDIAAMYADA